MENELRKVQYQRTKLYNYGLIKAIGEPRKGLFHRFAEDGTIALIEDEETGKLDRVHISEGSPEIIFLKGKS